MERQDEWRVASVSSGCLGEVVIVGGDDETEEEEGDNIEERDSPEDLLGGLGDGLARVGGFSCSETNKLSSTKGKGSGHEHGAESLEAVSERTWLVPVVSANVASAVGGNATTVNDNTQDDETDDCGNLDQAKNEFDLAITTDTEEIDNHDADQEDCDPNTDVD